MATARRVSVEQSGDGLSFTVIADASGSVIMALSKCPECGHQVSTDGPAQCPGCGKQHLRCGRWTEEFWKDHEEDLEKVSKQWDVVILVAMLLWFFMWLFISERVTATKRRLGEGGRIEHAADCANARIGRITRDAATNMSGRAAPRDAPIFASA